VASLPKEKTPRAELFRRRDDFRQRDPTRWVGFLALALTIVSALALLNRYL
jgi:hypothetical protein